MAMHGIYQKNYNQELSGLFALLGLVLCLCSPTAAQAQFHQRSGQGKGGNVVTPRPSNIDTRDWKYGEMKAREAAVWGRTIFHPNGNFTESKLDEAQSTLQQQTFRAKKQDADSSVLLQKRLIKLNASGRPVEVLIYNAQGALTNRGTLFYDPIGRLTEERLFDTNSRIVRRKIQTYSAEGKKMPLRTFNYGKGSVGDVDLLITSESVQKEAQAAKKPKKSFLKKLRFWKKGK
ncbi:MAG: hypothetical protein L3J39_04730 [Verrucomicrobiales bacterium]|nr:hypothetical protein [Verrucomicrobiales bacterium]